MGAARLYALRCLSPPTAEEAAIGWPTRKPTADGKNISLLLPLQASSGRTPPASWEATGRTLANNGVWWAYTISLHTHKHIETHTLRATFCFYCRTYHSFALCTFTRLFCRIRSTARRSQLCGRLIYDIHFKQRRA